VQRADATGLGVAAAGHVLLFGVLSLGLITAPKPVPHMAGLWTSTSCEKHKRIDMYFT
jgi:hypothetical protein